MNGDDRGKGLSTEVPVGVTVMLIKLKRLFSDRFLIVTNTGLSVVLSVLGDCIQQKLESPSKTLKRDRIYLMGFSFGLTSGFLCHYWYKNLDKFLPGRNGRIILKKVLADQILFSPFLLLACFSVASWLERKSALSREILDKGTKLYLSEWLIWPPAQVVNFYFLPTKYRVLYDNLISLGYDGYTSKIKHQEGSS